MQKLPSARYPATETTICKPSFIEAPSRTTLSIARWVLPLTGACMLTAGTANMILMKQLTKTHVRSCESCAEKLFRAPFLLQFGHALGQLVCLGVDYIDRAVARCSGRSQGWLEYDLGESNSEEAGPLMWIFPAVCDYVASLTLALALLHESATAVQVLRNFSVVLCALFSVVILKSDFRIAHWVGVGLISIGLLLTGGRSIWIEVTTDDGFKGIAVLLVLISATSQVLQLIFQERLLLHYRIAPFRGVGWIGMWETVFVGVTLVFAHVFDWERFTDTWYSLSHYRSIRVEWALFALSVALFMSTGLAVTKMGAAILTSIVSSSQQIPIWITELVLGWESFRYVSLIGILLTVNGHLIYNYMWPKGCWTSWDRLALKGLQCRCTCHDVHAPPPTEYTTDHSDIDDDDDDDHHRRLEEQPPLRKIAAGGGGRQKEDDDSVRTPTTSEGSVIEVSSGGTPWKEMRTRRAVMVSSSDPSVQVSWFIVKREAEIIVEKEEPSRLSKRGCLSPSVPAAQPERQDER